MNGGGWDKGTKQRQKRQDLKEETELTKYNSRYQPHGANKKQKFKKKFEYAGQVGKHTE